MLDAGFSSHLTVLTFCMLCISFSLLVVCTFVSCVCVVFFPPSVFPYSLLGNSVILGSWYSIVKSSAVFQRICLRLACILAESGLLNSLFTFLYSALHVWNLVFASCLAPLLVFSCLVQWLAPYVLLRFHCFHREGKCCLSLLLSRQSAIGMHICYVSFSINISSFLCSARF